MSDRGRGEISKVNEKENMQDIRGYFMKEKKGEKRKITEGVDEIVIAYNKNNKENNVEGGGKAKKIKKEKNRLI